MTIIMDLMKADAESCNKRMRRAWGITSFVAGQEGIVRKPSQRVAARRQKVWDAYESGMKMREVADAFGLTLGTVKSDISAARLQLERDAA